MKFLLPSTDPNNPRFQATGAAKKGGPPPPSPGVTRKTIGMENSKMLINQ